jgi:branched-chain amino acid transport system ATP-binding protein
MIEVSDLHTYRGLNYVLQGVNLSIEQGACTVLLGRNGMGKTTLVHTIMGMLRPRSGRIAFGDEELVGKQPFQIARRGIALIPQGRRIFPSLTVEENLTLAVRGPAARGKAAAGRTAGDRQEPGGGGAASGAWTLDRVYDLFGNLAERRRLRGGQLSGGEQQMLAIARALLANPRLLLMDEPSEGLAPVVIERIGEILADLRREGLSIFLVEQNYGLAIALADTAYILSNGQVVWHGTPAELESSAEVRETYLGV